MLNEAISFQKFSKGKRFTIFLLDTLMSFVIFIVLFFSVGNISIKSICNNDINAMNEVYENICINNNLPYAKENQFGLYQIDFEMYMDKVINEGKTDEEAYEMYLEKDNYMQIEISKSDNYVKAYSNFYSTYTIVSILCMFIPLFIFHLLIPLTNKKHQTITMLMFKCALVDSKNSVLASNKQILLRFTIIFITEFICVYLILDWLGLIFVVLATLFSISVTKRNSTLHDLLTKLEIKDLDYCYSD